MIRFKSLGSGSGGNATVVQARDDARTVHLLIDCGLGIRELDKRLGAAGMLAEQIDATIADSGADALNLRVHAPQISAAEVDEQIDALVDVIAALRGV